MKPEIIAARNAYDTDGQTATLTITRRNGDQYIVKFDHADLIRVADHVWRIQSGRGDPYAVTGSPSKTMAHVLVGDPLEGHCVFHADGDQMNNSRDNLMMGTVSDRQRHAYQRAGKLPGCVIWHQKDQRWLAYAVGRDDRPVYLGSYPSREDAQAAREQHAA